MTRPCWQAVLDRVSNAGYEALIVNIDCRDIGHRERDYHNGFTAPPSIKPKTVLEGALRPRWALGFLANDAIAFPNLDAHIPEGPLTSTPDMWRTLLAGSYEPTDWSDIEDIRTRWNGPIILKGCVNPKDAAIAAGMGIDAIQVSNHGGRQLDHMASPMDVLPDMVDAAAGRMEIIVDGGIRRGSDVIKALALGADACAIGRPYLYGLAAAGEVGVSPRAEAVQGGNAPHHGPAGCHHHCRAEGGRPRTHPPPQRKLRAPAPAPATADSAGLRSIGRLLMRAASAPGRRLRAAAAVAASAALLLSLGACGRSTATTALPSSAPTFPPWPSTRLRRRNCRMRSGPPRC